MEIPATTLRSVGEVILWHDGGSGESTTTNVNSKSRECARPILRVYM